MNVTVREAAEKLSVTEQFVRVGLQQGKFPFGTAVEFKRWSYFICRPLFEAYLRGEVAHD